MTNSYTRTLVEMTAARSLIPKPAGVLAKHRQRFCYACGKEVADPPTANHRCNEHAEIREASAFRRGRFARERRMKVSAELLVMSGNAAGMKIKKDIIFDDDSKWQYNLRRRKA